MSFLSQSSDPVIELQKAYSVLSVEHAQAIQRIQGLEEEITHLKEQLLLMQKRQFGKKTEAQVGELIANPQLQSVAGYTRRTSKKTCGRTLDTRALSRHKVFYNLGALHCPCGCLFKKMGGRRL
jgi:TolA-binding protein